MRWWTEARFGMFIHWGPVSLKGTEIGWSRGREVPLPVYDNLDKEFNPTKFDAREYVALAKEAGMKYITLTTKHHDGFSMFATKLSDYNVLNTPFKRDITRELADSAGGKGCGFAYYLIIDWHHPDYLARGAGDTRPAKDADFKRYALYEGPASGTGRKLPPGRPLVRRRVGGPLDLIGGATSTPCSAGSSRADRQRSARQGAGLWPRRDDAGGKHGGRLRHARTGDGPLLRRPQHLLGELHHARRPVGVEAE